MPSTGSLRKLKLPVPVHIITGSLGTGKTTLITKLIANKQTQNYANEIWAVLVNEWGDTGIDQALLQGAVPPPADVTVRQLAGGCLCCTLPTVTQAAIVQLLRSTKPDRLFIEPSGLAHPQALLELLQGEHLKAALTIMKPVICLVDLTRCDTSSLETTISDMAGEQASIADVLIGTKADTASEQQIEAFKNWACGLGRPERPVLIRSTTAILPEDVGLISGDSAQPATAAALHTSDENPFPYSFDTLREQLPSSSSAPEMSISPGQPLRQTKNDDNQLILSCGWVFSAQDRFNQQLLKDFLAACSKHRRVLRLKGVFSIGEGQWTTASAINSKLDMSPIESCLDSRIEVLLSSREQNSNGIAVEIEGVLDSEDGIDTRINKALELASSTNDWTLFEKLLLQCLL